MVWPLDFYGYGSWFLHEGLGWLFYSNLHISQNLGFANGDIFHNDQEKYSFKVICLAKVVVVVINAKHWFCNQHFDFPNTCGRCGVGLLNCNPSLI